MGKVKSGFTLKIITNILIRIPKEAEPFYTILTTIVE